MSYDTSTKTIQTSFLKSPPYTIQRLAELVLYPRKHYRYLPPFLAALDKVVTVSSPVSNFPLPQLHLNSASTNGNYLTNGESTNGAATRDGLASDESLGGALLTPIPWLRKDNSLADAAAQAQRRESNMRSEGFENAENADGVGRLGEAPATVNGLSSTLPQLSDEEKALMTTEQSLRAEGAVTQGELLRQEQEAGVVPVVQTGVRRHMVPGSSTAGHDDMTAAEEDEKLEEHPHARGPDLIGMEDMGPQDGDLGATRPLDMGAAVGRSRSQSPPPTGEDKSEERPELRSGVGETEDVEMTD